MRRIAGWLTILIIAGCTNHTKVPPGVIPQKKMEKIMWDMVQADRFVNSFIMSRKDSLPEKKKEAAIFYERVFKLHGITREEFLKSYKFYLGRPDLTKKMFDSISAQSERRRSEVHMPIIKNNNILRTRDSLVKLDSLRKKDSLRKEDSIRKFEKLHPSTLDLFSTEAEKKQGKKARSK